MGTVADSRVTANLLLFADSRLPAGGHAHSGGVERAVAAGAVRDMPTLEGFLRGRLATAGAQSAAIAAYACRSANDDPAPAFTCWHLLDAEVSARMSSPAQRSASLVVMPGVGHVSSVEAPELFNRTVGDFLRTAE